HRVRLLGSAAMLAVDDVVSLKADALSAVEAAIAIATLHLLRERGRVRAVALGRRNDPRRPVCRFRRRLLLRRVVIVEVLDLRRPLASNDDLGRNGDIACARSDRRRAAGRALVEGDRVRTILAGSPAREESFDATLRLVGDATEKEEGGLRVDRLEI